MEACGMIIFPVVWFFPPVEFCKLLAATCLRFLVVWGCHWNWTRRKNHTTAGFFFCLVNIYTGAQICTQGPDRADRQGDAFRISFFSWLDSTTLPKRGPGRELSGGALVYLNSLLSPKFCILMPHLVFIIWLFSLKTGSIAIITQIKSVWSSN